MAAFSYAVLDHRGKQIKGLIEADSKRQARQLLRDKGWTPLNVDESGASASSDSQSGTGFSLRRRVSVAEISALTRQLAIVLKAGIPLEEALGAVGQQTARASLRAIIMGVRGGVLEGRSLANSLRDYPDVFSNLYCATVGAGEHSGYLDLVMEQLADYTERSHANIQKTRLALIYPVLLFIMSIAIVAVLMVFVVPDIVDVYISQGQALPLLTRFVISLSGFVSVYGFYLLVAVLLVFVAIRYVLQNSTVRLAWHKRLIGLPMLGNVIRRYNAARFASTLAILARGGVPLVEAIRIAGNVLANDYLKEQVMAVSQQVEEGSSLHRSLEQSGHFPPLMIHMIASGEAAGELEEMLSRVAENQQQELDNMVNTLVSLFEPATLLIMGGIVLVIVVAILQPMLTLNQLIG